MIENELPPPSQRVRVFFQHFQLFNVRSHRSYISAGSCAGYSYANKAFIFSLYNVRGYNPVRLTQYRKKKKKHRTSL